MKGDKEINGDGENEGSKGRKSRMEGKKEGSQGSQERKE